MQKNIRMMIFSSKKCFFRFFRILRPHTSQEWQMKQMKTHRWKLIRKTHTQEILIQMKKSYRWKSHTDEKVIQMKKSYRWKSYTDENLIQMKISYRWKFHTDENLIQMKISYRWKFHTGENFIQVKISYRWKSHTVENLTKVKNFICDAMFLVRCCSFAESTLRLTVDIA
jgi:hypothetical protein